MKSLVNRGHQHSEAVITEIQAHLMLPSLGLQLSDYQQNAATS